MSASANLPAVPATPSAQNVTACTANLACHEGREWDGWEEQGWSADRVRELFPFMLIFDDKLRLTSVGRGLTKAFHDIRPGRALADVFVLEAPRIHVSFASFAQARSTPVLLRSIDGRIRLRGQMVGPDRCDGGQRITFIGSPWFFSFQELAASGLTLDELVAHDPLVGYLHRIQAHALAGEEARREAQEAVLQRDELAASNRKLSDASAAMSRLLANTSHELRTPLNGILGMAALVLRTDLGDTQRDYVEKIHRSGRTLLRVVNDVLDYFKMEAGRLTMDTVTMDLLTVCHEAAELFAVPAQEKRVELVCSVDPGVPKCLRGDPARVRQLISNLLSNAVKFTETGSVVLRAEVETLEQNVAHVVVSVIDSGVGIPESELGRLFNAFSQVDSPNRQGGTGLGLAICKHLARLMGGTVGVESRPGHGSRFFARLPLQREAGSAEVRRTLSSDVRVLVVDDCEASWAMVAEHLRYHGAEVSCAASAAAARRLMLEQEFDLVVIDEELAVELRPALHNRGADGAGRTVLLRAALPDGSAAQAPVENEVVLLKPVHPARLLGCANALLGTRSPTPVRLTPVPRPKNRGRNVLIVDDNPINREVASRMAQALGYEVGVAADGREALDALGGKPYALVLMDVQMPVLNGYEATRKLRAIEGVVRHTPVVAMTAHAMDDDRKQAIASGMDGFLEKPLDFEALAAVLREHVGEPAQSTADHTPVASPTPERAIVVDALNELRKLQTRGEPDFRDAVVTQFLGDVPRVSQALHGAKAEADFGTLGSLAHQLKSSSGILGAFHLSELCGSLERACRKRDGALVDQLFPRLVSELRRAAEDLDAILHGRRAPDVTDAKADAQESGRRFLSDVTHQLRTHPVFCHPFLGRLRRHAITRAELTRYAIEQAVFSRRIAADLPAVLACLPEEARRPPFILYMSEPLDGILHSRPRDEPTGDAAVAGTPGVTDDHEAYRRLLDALGVTRAALGSEPLPHTVQHIEKWRAICRSSPLLMALGAMGPATLCMLPAFHGALLESIERGGWLGREDCAFLLIHVEAVKTHGDGIIRALAGDAADAENQSLLAEGAQRALDAHCAWFDGLMQQVFDVASPSIEIALPAQGGARS